MGLDVTMKDGVVVLALDWPDRRNALGPEQGRELVDQLAALRADPELRALVLTGTGAFCAGGDLTALRALVQQGAEAVRESVYGVFQAVIRHLVEIEVPTIAAVDGAAVGLGMDIALACDRRLVGPHGWFGQGWARIGLIPGTGGVLLLQRLRRDLLWRIAGSQERIDAKQAEEWGLGERVPDGTALDAAVDQAAITTRLPAETVAGYLRLDRAPLRAQLDEHLEACLEVQVGLLTAPEFLKRTAAYA